MVSHGTAALASASKVAHAPGEFGLVRGCQADVLRRQAIPKLAYEVEAFLRGQARNVERRHVR
jgi:hypothetical protein